MTVSMRVMSAGDGYKYLLKTVAAADGNRPLSTPLTRYYMEEGTPPGRWLGAGVAALGKGEIQVGDRVSEHQLWIAPGLVEGGLCRLGGCRGGGDVSVVGCFVLGGWDVSAVAVQA